MSGVLVLSLSTVIVKIIGLAYKIPMIARLGTEGMGYFNSAYEIYAMLCVIATAGLPVALSMLISTHRERGKVGAIRRIWRVALAVFLVIGGLGSLLMLALARPLAGWIGNEGAYLCMMAIAPALFFVCFSSAVRGYFQGYGNMVPTAVSQLIEAVGKLIFGIWFASIALERGLSLPAVAAFAVLGLSLGTLLSALYLLLVRAISPGEASRPVEESGKERHLLTLLRIALPITVSSAVLSVTRLVDMTLIMRRLQAIGVSAAEANSIYGAYTTLAVPVFGLIPSLITPISLALVPQLSAAIESRTADGQAAVSDQAIRLTVLLAMPASLGIATYAKPILNLLFADEPDAVALAAPLLSLLGVSILFSGLITTTGAILQSYRKTGKPIVSMAVGALIKTVSAYLLIGLPGVGVYGAPISTFFCNLTITAMNFWFLGSCIPKSRLASGMLQTYGKPLAASVLAILASVAVYLPIEAVTDSGTAAFLAAFGIAVVCYAALALLMGVVTETDLARLPMGERLLGLYRRKKQRKNGDQVGG